MTIQNIIDAVIHRMAGGDMTPEQIGKYHPGVVKRFLSVVFNDVMYTLYRQNDPSIDLYAREYERVVDYSSTRDLKYITLPVKIIELPLNKGIRMVSYTQDQTTEIPIISQQAQSSMANMDVGLMDNDVYGFMVGDTIYLRNLDPFVSRLLVNVIPAIDEYDDDDDLYLPSGQGTKIVDMVCQLMVGLQEEDVKNDNNTTR